MKRCMMSNEDPLSRHHFPFSFLKPQLPKIEMPMVSPWFFCAPPVICIPDRKNMMMEMAKYNMRKQLEDEIEQDADNLWQLIMIGQRLKPGDFGAPARYLSVEEATGLCEYWFGDGYSGWVRDRAEKYREV